MRTACKKLFLANRQSKRKKPQGHMIIVLVGLVVKWNKEVYIRQGWRAEDRAR